MIKTKFGETSRYTPTLLDSFIVERFVDGIVALLHEVAEDARHELRNQFDQAVQELIRELSTSTEYREKGHAHMRDFIAHVRRESYYRVLWDDISQQVETDLRREHSVLREYIAGALALLGKRLLEDPAVQHKLSA